MTKTGFIGLGAIGYPVARHVARSGPTWVWNRTISKARSLAEETGANVANSPADLVAAVDVVFTCLPTTTEVFGMVKSVESWREGQLLVDTTSGDPGVSKDIAAWLDDKGVGYVDAPLSGGTSGAEAGKLTVMMGGEESWKGKAREACECFAAQITDVGPVGAGNAVKAVNQTLLAINIQAAGEGLAALTKLGVKPSVALEVINASSGRSNVTQNLIPERTITGDWLRTFRLSLLNKDVGIAVKLLGDTEVPGPATALAKVAMEAAMTFLDDDEADHVEAIKRTEAAAGVEIRG